MHQHDATPERRQAQSVIFLSKSHFHQIGQKVLYITNGLRHPRKFSTQIDEREFQGKQARDPYLSTYVSTLQ